jgi:sterol desaturase/sphingolipid hydroxylase (fatty acid hydroxylase superfamily)
MSWFLAKQLMVPCLPDAAHTWWVPSLMLGVTFILTTLLLTAADLCPSKTYESCGLRRRKAIEWQQVVELTPVVLRNISLAAVAFYVSWNLRLFVTAPWVKSESVNVRLLLAPANEPFDVRLDATTNGWWSTTVPMPARMFLQLAALNVISQVWFFFAHRWAHSNAHVFRFVHSMHHRHSAPFAMTAVHCSMSEMLLLNVPAAGLGPLLLVPDWWAHCAWMVLAGLYTPIAHSGHSFINGFMDARFHDDHHRYLDVNFGSDFLDRLFGTHADQKKTHVR